MPLGTGGAGLDFSAELWSSIAATMTGHATRRLDMMDPFEPVEGGSARTRVGAHLDAEAETSRLRSPTSVVGEEELCGLEEVPAPD